MAPAIMNVFFDELQGQGFIEGKNLSIDRRGMAVSYDQFPALAAEWSESKVDAIICAGEAATRAAQGVTKSVPLLAMVDDMVGAGLVPSLAKPGGNTTGISIVAGDLDGKRQELLMDLVASARQMAALSDIHTNTPAQLQAVQEVARARGVTLAIHTVERKEDISPTIQAASAGRTAN